MKLCNAKICVLASFAISGLLVGSSALAADECLDDCRSESKDCLSESREMFALCTEGFGCGELRSAFREACFTRDRDVETCREAAKAIKSCVSPCKDDLFDDLGTCREAMDVCVEETCGVESPYKRLLDLLSRYRR